MSDQDYRYRPLATWPYPETQRRRSRHTFKASWADTIKLLVREVRLLSGKNLVIGAGFREQDLRLDGLPRAGAQVPPHPGVEISFDATVGGRQQRLVYATDVCERWTHNVRSIALGLESLRAVDRYGITRRGEQYAGFRALPRGADDGSPERGAEIIQRYGLTEALRRTHPDRGGSPEDFRDVVAARDAGAAA